VNVLPIDSAGALYACARSRSVTYHTVEHATFQRFYSAARRLERAAGERADEDVLRPLIRDARRLRFELATAPLPFNDATVHQRVGGDHDSIARKVALIYPGIAQDTAEVARLLTELLASGDSPFQDVIDTLGGRGTALVLRKARLVSSVQAVLRARPATRDVEVLDLDAIRSARTFNRLIVCGPSHWFPDYVFSAPRAADVHVVSYAWQRSEWEPRSPFVANASEHARRRVVAPVGDESPEAWPEVDWEAISLSALGTDGARHDLVEARLFLLSGGLAVFLDCRSSALVIDVEAEGNQRVSRVSSDDIVPGTYLLLRTEGGGDYIVPLADQVLGARAKGYRAMQRDWKERLRHVVATSPEPDVRNRLIDVSLRLIDLGATRADEGNLRYWMSARSIKTQDMQDFRAIMELVGLGSEADRYWGVMRQILAAHHQAGRRIRRRLIDRVRAGDLGDREQAGRIDFALPDEEGGKLSAFLVEGRAPNRTQVPVARESDVFERED
jgi:hypothetical protein